MTSDAEWFVAVGGNQLGGTRSADEIRCMLASGELDARAYVIPRGGTAWQLIGEAPEFKDSAHEAFSKPAAGSRKERAPGQTVLGSGDGLLNLLEGEEVIADLRRGLVQRVTQDLLLLKTAVLTSRRMLLVSRRMGSFEKKYVFLEDITSLESRRRFRLGVAVLIGACVLWGIGLLAARQPGAFLGLLVLAGIGSLFLKTNQFVVSTMTEDLILELELSLSTDRIDSFIDVCQVHIQRLKGLGRGAQGSAPDPGDHRECPMCAERIRVRAKKCRFCGEVFEEGG